MKHHDSPSSSHYRRKKNALYHIAQGFPDIARGKRENQNHLTQYVKNGKRIIERFPTLGIPIRRESRFLMGDVRETRDDLHLSRVRRFGVFQLPGLVFGIPVGNRFRRTHE